MTVKSHETTTDTTRTSFVELPTLKFAKKDNTFPCRLVGSYEYGKSLDYLGQLASSSTLKEVEVYDKLIAMNPEYSFYSGVASSLGLDVRFDSLDRSAKAKVDSDFLKQSLAWMMALARSELGATISMYGSGEDPFGAAVAIGGVGFGSEELLSILVDDLAAHLKAAQVDGSYQAALDPKDQVDESSLGYLRRTKLINDMLAKVMSSGNPEIVRTARPYAQMSDTYVRKMAEKIVVATTPGRYEASSESYRETSSGEEITGLRFQRRTNLLQCQQRLERWYGPPQEIASALQ